MFAGTAAKLARKQCRDLLKVWLERGKIKILKADARHCAGNDQAHPDALVWFELFELPPVLPISDSTLPPRGSD
jgi:hypothetical protein